MAEAVISTGLLAPEGACELNAPMVYLAPDRHAFLVLGDGSEPLITWSTSYQFASEQADIHGGVVVAVPIVRDSSWRRSHGDDPTQVPVRLTSMPRRDGPAQSAGEPTITWSPPGPHQIIGGVDGQGYPVGRAARDVGGQGSPDGWSSARPDVEGQRVSTEGLVRRSQPFGDPAAPLLPEDPEAALRAAFGGGCGPATDEAMTAFHTPGHADVATLEKLRDGLGHE